MSTAVRRALYGKMAGDTTLNALLGTSPTGYAHSIYYEVAPAGAGFPYVVFNKVSGVPDYAMRGRIVDNDLWQIKAVSQGSVGSPQSADVTDNIATRLDELFTDPYNDAISPPDFPGFTITISGRTLSNLRRESDLNYAEKESDGNVYRHSGSIFRLIYS